MEAARMGALQGLVKGLGVGLPEARPVSGFRPPVLRPVSSCQLVSETQPTGCWAQRMDGPETGTKPNQPGGRHVCSTQADHVETRTWFPPGVGSAEPQGTVRSWAAWGSALGLASWAG